MYGFTMLQLKIGGLPATQEEVHVVELDYPLGRYTRTMLRIGPKFDKPLDDDVPTDEERLMGYSDDESKEGEQSDNGNSGENYGDDKGANDDMIH